MDFGLFIGNIGLINEKKIRKRSNLHLLGCFRVQKLHFALHMERTKQNDYGGDEY